MFPFAESKHCHPEPGQPKATIVRFPSLAECRMHFQTFFREREWEWENLETPNVVPNPPFTFTTTTTVTTPVAKDDMDVINNLDIPDEDDNAHINILN